MALNLISSQAKYIIHRVVCRKTFITSSYRAIHRTIIKMAGGGADQEITRAIRAIIPEMTASQHKGQSGRIGIVGGCKEYTGAPYFAGISALKVGADLAHVFCTEGAAPAIKSYSPELIVHPVLDASDAVTEVLQWLPRLHALVIGPGLGQDTGVFETVKEIVCRAKDWDMPLVIDADGLILVSQVPEVITGYKKAILTPNKMELKRLAEKLTSKTAPDLQENDIQQLASQMGGLTIVSKGASDIITDGVSKVVCNTQGSYRRCGGQGDLLSGSLGTFAHWAYNAGAALEGSTSGAYKAPVVAGYAACYLTRQCNKKAFETHKRSMTTSDMIACIGQVFDAHFEVNISQP